MANELHRSQAMQWRTLLLVLLLGASANMTGCAVGGAIGAVTQEYEYQKRIEVPAKYTGLQNKSVAIVVQADLATLYEFPDLTANIAGVISNSVAVHVTGARVLSPSFVASWQHRTPSAAALPFGEIASQLGVDRVVLIDIYEYRHNPPGNRWQWEGVCGAHVGIIERDALDPDTAVDTFDIVSEFPNVAMLTREEADENQVRLGLTLEFTRQVTWLFYDHLEAKYPDKYRPEVDAKPKK